jgi:predicted dienelactone hydrolase
MGFKGGLVSLLLATAASAQVRGVGLHSLQLADPVGEGTTRAEVFYPAAQPSTSFDIDLFQVDASRELEPIPGRHPLILLSHGHGGSRWGHHDLASALARKGFVVATLDHAGDSFADPSGAGTDRVWLGRAVQLRALLDAVLAEPKLSARVDASRIGAAGFSAGGYSVLLLAGARPDFSRLERQCAKRKDSVLCSELGRVQVTRPSLMSARVEPRVRAVFAMAPVGVFFDKEGLKDVKVPVRLYAAAEDRVLPVADHADHIRDSLPSRPEYTRVPRAGHFVFLAPCKPGKAKAVPELCVDPPGVDRKKLHQQLASEAERFFRRALSP